MKREKVTIPEDAADGSRLTEKSAIQLSKSPALLVEARVVCRTWRINHCIHSAMEAFASSTARRTEPTVKSSS